MPHTLVRDVPARVRNLTPFQTTPYPLKGITGNYAAVCTPVCTVPAPLQQAQADRTAYYLTNNTPETGYGRKGPDHGPRYYVTSNGTLIAHVTLDGTVHYAPTTDLSPLQRKHQAMVRAALPTRFTMNDEGDPVRSR